MSTLGVAGQMKTFSDTWKAGLGVSGSTVGSMHGEILRMTHRQTEMLKPWLGISQKEVFRLRSSIPKWDAVGPWFTRHDRSAERAFGGLSTAVDAMKSFGLTAKVAAGVVPLEPVGFRDLLRDASTVSETIGLRTEFRQVVDRLSQFSFDEAEVVDPASAPAIRPGPGVSRENFRLWLEIIATIISVLTYAGSFAQGQQAEELLKAVRAISQETREGRAATTAEQRQALERMDARLRALKVKAGLTNRKTKLRVGPSTAYGSSCSVGLRTPVAILETRKRWVFVLVQDGDVQRMGWVPKKAVTRP
jgi:hypothetical protein